MANFEESRFLGLSPRAIGMGIVAVGVVVGLFFIPETVKFLFDSKPRQSKARIASTDKVEKSSDAERAGLSPDALNQLRADIAKPKAASSKSGRREVGEEDTAKGDGFFSGWNFRVQAGTSGRDVAHIPPSLTFERISSKDGIAFIKRGKVDVSRFFRRERLSSPAIQEAAQPFVVELDGVSAAAAKGLSADEIGMAIKVAHVKALQGMYRAGADRAFLMRWLELPIVRFVDDRGGVGAIRKIRAGFAPSVLLVDLKVRQRPTRGWGFDARSPVSASAEMAFKGGDIDRVVVYANGKQVRTVKFGKRGSDGVRTVRFNGDAYGVWSFVAYDKYGARPFTKSYSFYPRARTFQRSPNGTYLIGFLPGSARNSLDRFFYVGGSGRATNRDPVVSKF
jgi:hypothetical protein